MGEPIDPIVDPILGDDCIFMPVPAETPKYLYVYFWDIIDCPASLKPAPNGHLFKLTQHDVIPCFWLYSDVAFGFRCEVDVRGISPWGIELRDQNLNLYFRGQLWNTPAEHDVLNNVMFACDPGIFGVLGFATLFWKEAAVKLVEDFVLPTDSSIMMEFFMKDDVSPVYKFCFPKYSMNIKFLVSP